MYINIQKFILGICGGYLFDYFLCLVMTDLELEYIQCSVHHEGLVSELAMSGDKIKPLNQLEHEMKNKYFHVFVLWINMMLKYHKRCVPKHVQDYSLWLKNVGLSRSSQDLLQQSGILASSRSTDRYRKKVLSEIEYELENLQNSLVVLFTDDYSHCHFRQKLDKSKQVQSRFTGVGLKKTSQAPFVYNSDYSTVLSDQHLHEVENYFEMGLDLLYVDNFEGPQFMSSVPLQPLVRVEKSPMIPVGIWDLDITSNPGMVKVFEKLSSMSPKYSQCVVTG